MVNLRRAQEALATFRLPDWRERRQAQVARLPGELARMAEAVLDLNPPYEYSPRQPSRYELHREAIERLDSLTGADRARLLAAVFPTLATHVEAAWSSFGRRPYQTGIARKPFRAPRQPAVAQPARVSWLHELLVVVEGYEQDLAWFAAWAPYLHWGQSDALDLLFDAAIDTGGPDGQAVYEVLTASALGKHPVGMMGRHVTRGLLAASRPEGWDFLERILLDAERPEAVWTTVLDTMDDAHTEAFVRMLRLMSEHGFARFERSRCRLGAWLGFGEESLSARSASAAADGIRRFLEDPTARVRALSDGEPKDLYLALWATAFEDAPAALAPAVGLLADANVERRFVGAHLLAQLGLDEANRALLPALQDADLRVAARAFKALGNYVPATLLAGTDLYERLEAFLARLPRRAQTLTPIVWPWMSLTVRTSDVAEALLAGLGLRSPKRLLPHLPHMEPGTRARIATLMAGGKQWDKETRAALLTLVGDASPGLLGLSTAGIRLNVPGGHFELQNPKDQKIKVQRRPWEFDLLSPLDFERSSR